MDQMSQPQASGARRAIETLRRFASPAIEPQVRALLDTNFDKLDCDERVELMAYLQRTNPAAAEKFLPRLKFGAWPNCSLQNVASRYWSPAVESAELARLDNSDPKEVQAALQDLKENASPAARPVILRHFEAWSAANKPKLDATGAFASAADPAAQLEHSYLYTLIGAYGWNPTAEDIEEYGRVCLTADCRKEAERVAQLAVHGPPFIRISPANTTPLTFALGLWNSVGDMQRLKGKIEQYPKGTAFRLDARFNNTATIDKVVATPGPWMTAHGYELSLYREPVPAQ